MHTNTHTEAGIHFLRSQDIRINWSKALLKIMLVSFVFKILYNVQNSNIAFECLAPLFNSVTAL